MNESFSRKIFEALYDSDNIEEGIQRALAIIGERFCVSRVYIFENSKDGLYASNTFEWCAPGIEPQIDNLQELSYEEYGYRELFNEDGLFFSSDVSLLDPIQRGLFESQGIRATIQFALYDKDAFRGLIGFDDCNGTHPEWDCDGETVEALVFLSKLMAVYLLKERNLQEASAYYEQLEDALAAAVDANRAKTDFLSRMSHDIRTPLNGIVGMTEIALMETEEPQTKANLEVIASSSRFLLSLINDILDISRIESGKLRLRPAPLALSTFDEMIDSVIRPLMAEKGIDFTYQMNCGLTCARVDELRFEQIFFNLLSNAAKFTPKGGHVAFSAEALSSEGGTEWVRFSVKDDGIGMSEEFARRAFEPFEQAGNTGFDGQQRHGTGLGLAIVREIATLMGGTVTVRSQLGRGSEFVVDLPMEKCELSEAVGAGKALAGGRSLEGVRILLVEDNEINALVTVRLLQGAGAEVTCAANGAEGLEAFERSCPGEYAAVLMDVRMPVMDGLEATRRLRKLPRPDAAHVPVIAMTANIFEDDIANCLAAGMDAHLAKPIEPGRLLGSLAEWIGRP